MSKVVVSPRASSDVDRLEEWLLDRGSPDTALRFAEELKVALRTLSDLPNRGRNIGAGFKELVVPFGRDAYLIQYQVRGEEVFVARIRHRRERR